MLGSAAADGLLIAQLLCSAATTNAFSALAPSGTWRSERTESFWEHDAWKVIGPGSGTVEVVFAVVQNTAELPDLLDRVSTPGSPDFGRRYTLAELRGLLANEAAGQAVQEFLSCTSVASSPNGEFISATMNVTTANSLFNTTFYLLEERHAKRRAQQILRAPQFALPQAVADAVDFVAHVTELPPTRSSQGPGRFVNRKRPGAAHSATPSKVSEVYGITDNTVATARSTNAVYEPQQVFESTGFLASDVALFDKQNGLPSQVGQIHIQGANNADQCSQEMNDCLEPTIDLQQITSIAQHGSTTYWSVAYTKTYLDWMMEVASDPHPPLVHSSSWSMSESFAQYYRAMWHRFDVEVMKLGLRGVTVIAASGDDGVYGSNLRDQPSVCAGKFQPSFPQSAPHVTAVGGTQGPESDAAEVGCSSDAGGEITSGGGFSDVFSAPKYQKSSIRGYERAASKLPPKAKYNTTGRAYPDVSLMAYDFPAIVNGASLGAGVSGTSFSAPVFAAMVTLVNGKRLRAGKRSGMASLGFLNNILYTLGAGALKDITAGNNRCAAGNLGDETCCEDGFVASKGWDPVTGLGSVHFPSFEKALMDLP